MSLPTEHLKTLIETLGDSQVLVPGNPGNSEDDKFSEAVFIGNLNFQFTTPAAVVRPRSIEDVQFIVDFSHTHGIRLTVKNGGHSYMGYCLNDEGIVLDMCLMKKCEVDPDRMTITMEGGLLWKDAYGHLKDPHNMVIGGLCPSVGVSGFTLGGGLSPFSRSYGLGCDNVLEMTMVTYKGDLVTAKKDDEDKEKRNLFWALAGGGGGNFGVMVSMTCQMHKLRDDGGKVVCGDIVWNLPQRLHDFENMMKVFNTKEWPKELTMDAVWSHGKGKQLTGGFIVVYNGGMEAAQRVLAPLLKFNPDKDELEEMLWKDCVIHSERWDVKSRVYHHHASFILAKGAITPEFTQLISGLIAKATEVVGITDEKNQNDPKCHFLWDHIGGATEEVNAEDTPFYWRQGHHVSTLKVQWNNADEGPKIMEFLAMFKKSVQPYAIDAKAAYVNYIDNTVDQWQEAYYNRNYPRLQEVKTKWDPKNFFHHGQSIEPAKHGQREEAVYSEIEVPVGEMLSFKVQGL